MGLNSYSGILVAFALVVGLIVYGVIHIAWSIRPRKTVDLGVNTSFDGATHILPGEGHVEATDCMCRPRVYGLHGEQFVEHQVIRPVHRADLT